MSLCEVFTTLAGGLRRSALIMTKPYVDITLIGAPELQAKLQALDLAVQKRIVRAAFRKSARRIKQRIITNISGDPVEVRTGTYLAAWKATKIAAGLQKRGRIRIGIRYPEREDLGIKPADPYYYPYAIEYGHASAGRGGRRKDEKTGRAKWRGRTPAPKDVSAIPHVRPAVDGHLTEELAVIKQDIAAGIVREATKAAAKAAPKTAA